MNSGHPIKDGMKQRREVWVGYRRGLGSAKAETSRAQNSLYQPPEMAEAAQLTASPPLIPTVWRA